MHPIVLKKRTENGMQLEATFRPDLGMNLLSYKRNGIEVMAPSTENSSLTLRGSIGPHFNSRRVFPEIKEENLFAHVRSAQAQGYSDPFPNGIGSHAPWQASFSENKLQAVLSGQNNWYNTPLSSLQGQNFKMELKAELTSEGLEMEISTVSEADSLAGFRYVFGWPNGCAKVISKVQKHYLNPFGLHEIPSEWNNQQSQLSYQLDRSQEVNCVFAPLNPLEGKILLETDSYRILTTYYCCCQENCWQVHYPADASYLCISPMSAKDPYHPNLTVSSIRVKLQILGEENDEL